jgi:hypothetical protein
MVNYERLGPLFTAKKGLGSNRTPKALTKAIMKAAKAIIEHLR